MKKLIVLLALVLVGYSVVPIQSAERITYSYVEHVLETVNYLIAKNALGSLSTINKGDSLYTVVVTKYNPYTKEAVAPDSVNISLKELVVIKNKMTADLVIINQAINFLRTK